MLHCKLISPAYLPVPNKTIGCVMSKQLAISASFSVFAMAAFVLSATPDFSQGQMAAGAQAEARAPAGIAVVADLAFIAD